MDEALDRAFEGSLKLEVEVKRDGTVRLLFPSLDERSLMQVVRSLPHINTDRRGQNVLAGAVERRSRLLEERMQRIEEKVSSLVEITEKIVDSLGNSGSKKRGVRIPSRGTKYNEVLRRLTLEHGSEPFDSSTVPESERHILSILNNRYNALEVIENRGRTNIYRVREEIIHKIFSEEGECLNIEIRGKSREVVERALRSNKETYPKFNYVYREGADMRHVYTLIFGDPSVKLSVMENLSRSVGSQRNMKIYSESAASRVT